MLKKVLAITLIFTMLFSVCAVSVSALAPAATTATATTVSTTAEMSFSDRISNHFYYILDRLLNWLLSYVNFYTPKRDWTAKEDYVPVNFYEGTEEFSSSPDEGAKWYLGYSSASLLEGQDVFDGNHYMGGGISLTEPKTCIGIMDDQRVRTFAISDGSDGIICYAIIDSYALCSGDILQIRELLNDFAQKNNIVSINIGSLHQHSCIDTLGINGELLKALVQNPATLAGISNADLHSGRNPAFMENLFNVVAGTVEDAVADMKEGDLYYGTADALDLMNDKRDPQVVDPNLNRLRFVPNDENTDETWIVSAGIHCVGLGASTREVSGDYPYYLEKEIKEQVGANLVYVQGALLAVSVDNSSTSVEGNSRLDNVKTYAKELARRVINIDNDEIVAPLINIRHTQVFLPVENQVLSLCAHLGIYNTTVVDKRDGSYEMVSEIGYMELGNNLAIFLAPGEMAPEIAYGGAVSAEDSWNGESWDYPSMQEYIADSGRKMLVYGLINDEVGYMLTDNDYRSIFTENEEVNTSSGKVGSSTMEAFMALYDGV